MDSLPNEITGKIVDYLPPYDAVNVSRASKHLRSRLSLAITRPTPFLSKYSRENDDDLMHYGFEIPMMVSQASVHTMRVAMKWNDQGWGNRKGKLMIVAENKNQSYDRSDQRMGLGYSRVMYESRIARHSKRRLNIEFKTMHGESYHLWYVVGGGGGHALNLYNMKVQALVFDESKLTTKASDFITRSNGCLLRWDEGLLSHNHFSRQLRRDSFGSIRWDDRLSSYNQPRQLRCDTFTTNALASASCLLEEGESIPPPLVSYFESHGVSESNLSVELIQAIESALDYWSQKKCIYQEQWKSNIEADDNYPSHLITYDVEESDSDEEESDNSDDDSSYAEERVISTGRRVIAVMTIHLMCIGVIATGGRVMSVMTVHLTNTTNTIRPLFVGVGEEPAASYSRSPGSDAGSDDSSLLPSFVFGKNAI